MSLKMVPFKGLGAVSYSPSVVTMAISVAVCDILSVKEWPDLENGVSFVQGHRKWHQSHQLIDRIRVYILKLFAHTFRASIGINITL